MTTEDEGEGMNNTIVDRMKRDRGWMPVTREALAACRDQVARRTVGLVEGGVRIDAALLDDDEVRKLVELTQSEDALTNGDRRKWETLVEKSAGTPDLFEKRRKQAAMAVKLKELGRRALRPKAPTAEGEKSLILALHGQIKRHTLHLDRVGILVTILGQLYAAEPLGPHSRIEREGDQVVLVASHLFGVLSMDHDPRGEATVRWQEAVRQLAKNNWLDVVEGAEWRISLGSRALRALR
jgi:hypothetical protein